ncbi:winged helix-turn-helix transcriptional regulator [Candidatus Sumerlaeota bacterium]|nr:winged helix-turn-helix transcriptional regulator [Candidatus Sumerlaeota bacterium]
MANLDVKKISNFFKTLSHPTRVLITLELLQEKRCVTDIGELVNLPQPNISQHLAILKAGGIVDWTQQGKTKCYFLKDPQLIENLFKIFK